MPQACTGTSSPGKHKQKQRHTQRQTMKHQPIRHIQHINKKIVSRVNKVYVGLLDCWLKCTWHTPPCIWRTECIPRPHWHPSTRSHTRPPDRWTYNLGCGVIAYALVSMHLFSVQLQLCKFVVVFFVYALFFVHFIFIVYIVVFVRVYLFIYTHILLTSCRSVNVCIFKFHTLINMLMVSYPRE